MHLRFSGLNLCLALCYSLCLVLCSGLCLCLCLCLVSVLFSYPSHVTMMDVEGREANAPPRVAEVGVPRILPGYMSFGWDPQESCLCKYN